MQTLFVKLEKFVQIYIVHMLVEAEKTSISLRDFSQSPPVTVIGCRYQRWLNLTLDNV